MNVIEPTNREDIIRLWNKCIEKSKKEDASIYFGNSLFIGSDSNGSNDSSDSVGDNDCVLLPYFLVHQEGDCAVDGDCESWCRQLLRHDHENRFNIYFRQEVEEFRVVNDVSYSGRKLS